MADVLILLGAVIILLAGLAAVGVIRLARRDQLARERRQAVPRLRKDLLDTDEYIRKIGGVLSEDELDRLEDQEKEGK